MNIPKGYKLVPVEPTKKMLKVGHDAYRNSSFDEALVIYCTMLDAAPTPPKPICSALNFVCTALPGPGSECVFVELESDSGESLGLCEWRTRGDGLVELHISAPQPIYDEAEELEKFSTHWKLEGRIYRDKNTKQWLPTRDSFEGFQIAERVHALWLGWESCAQSRAKAVEVDHE